MESELGPAVAFQLQLTLMEAVEVKALVLVLIAVAVLAFAAGSILKPLPVTPSHSRRPVVLASRDSADDQAGDQYGNEVTNAVAQYTLDPAGSLYELHAPQVEIPKLASPKS